VTGELGETWASRNAFSFGRGGRGVERRSTLNKLMATTATVVQNIDSVEYGLTDIQEYYANTGAMVRAMDDIQGGAGKVQAAVVESFSRAPRPKKLNDVLRLEYRSKLLNPKWAESMVAQGSGGAFEVSQRMTAMVGWGATTKFQEKWVFDQSAATYALDPDMAARLREANPEAFKNIVGRLIEVPAPRPLRPGGVPQGILAGAPCLGAGACTGRAHTRRSSLHMSFMVMSFMIMSFMIMSFMRRQARNRGMS